MRLNPGDHACLLYERVPAEQLPALAPYLREGLEAGECVIYVADDYAPEELLCDLKALQLEATDAVKRGALRIWTRREWRPPGESNASAEAERLRAIAREVREAGFKGLRFAIEMTWALSPDISASRLGHCGAALNTLVRPEFPVRMICQYNRRRLAPATILGALQTHPLVIVRDQLCPNPFYQAPLSPVGAAAGGAGPETGPGAPESPTTAKQVDWMIEQLLRTRIAAQQREEWIRERARAAECERGQRALELLLERLGHGFVAIDSAGRIVFFNRVAAQFLERSRADALGRSWRDAFPEAGGTELERALESAGERGARLEFVHRGSGRVFEVQLSPAGEGGVSLVFCDLTAQKAGEAEARRHEKLNHAILRSSRDCIKTLALDGTLLSINEAAGEIFCLPDLTVPVGKSWIDCWPETERDAARRAVQAAAAGRKGRFHGSFSVHQQPRCWDVVITPMLDAEGRPEKLLAVSRDITELRQAEENLRRSEHLLLQFVENASIGLHRVGPDGTILWANPAEMEMLGYRREEYVGQNIARFHADPPVIADIMARLGRGERLRDYPARLLRRDGATKHVLIDSCVLWENGVFVHTQCFTRDVTEARKAEAEIRESEQRLRQLIDLMPSAFYACDAEGAITFYNRRAAQLWGREPPRHDSAERYCGALRLFLPEGRALSREETPMAEALRSGRSTRDGEMAIERPDGSLVWVRVNIDPIRDAEGRIRGAISVFQDITDAKARQREIERLNRELQRRLEEFEALIRTAPVGIGVAHDASCRNIWGNPAFSRMLGASPTENLSKSAPPADRLPFEVRKAGVPVPPEELPMQRACRTKTEVLGEELEIARADGTIVNELAFASPLFDADREVRGCIGVFLDITQKKQIEAALRDSEKLFRELADAMPQIVWVARADGRVDYHNRRWFEFAGAEDAARAGDGWGALLHPDDAPRWAETSARALREGQPYQIEFRLRERRSGDYRWFLTRAVPVRDGGGGVVRWFGTCTDIQEQKLAEERLERAVQDRTEKLRETIEELEAFSYSISHDMRGPVRSMQGYAQIIEEDFGDRIGPEGQEFLRRIRAAAHRMDRLIQDVLTLSRAARADISLAPVDVEKLLRGILVTYPNLRSAGAEIALAGKLPRVLGNEAALTQCFSNLLGNAVKFVAEGARPAVRVWAERHGDRVRVNVQDNGIGIPAEAHARIFRIFERVDDRYEGTGIGLAIVKTTAERMGGSVGMISAPGRGSTFWIELPAAGEPE